MPEHFQLESLTPELRQWYVKALLAERKGTIGPKSKAQLDAIRTESTRRQSAFIERDTRSLLEKAGGFIAEVGPESGGAAIGAGLGLSFGPPGVIGGGILGGLAGEAGQQISSRLFPSTAPPSGVPQTSQEAAIRLSEAGTLGALQEAGAPIRSAIVPASRIAAERLGIAVTRTGGTIPAAKELDVQLTPAQQTQGSILSATESILRRSLVGSEIFREADVVANRQLINAGEDIANEITRRKLSPREAGEAIQAVLKLSDDYADEAIGAVRKGIEDQAGDIPVDRRILSTRANQLLEEFDQAVAFSPKLENVDSLRNARGILGDFAAADEPLTISGAIKLRSQLLKLTRDREIGVGLGEIQQLTKSLDQSIENALKQSGNTALLGQFRASNAAFARTRQLLETGVAQHIIKSEKPEAIASFLLSTGGESGTANILKLVNQTKPAVRKDVQRALLSQLLDDAIQKDVSGVSEGVLVGDRLLSKLDKLGDDFLPQLFSDSPHILEKFQRFARVANTVSLKSSVTRPPSATSTSLLAFGQGTAATTMVGATMIGRPDVAVAAAPFVVGPPALAWIMTRPKGLELLTEAMLTPVSSPRAKPMAAKLAILIEEYNRQLARRKEPTGGATIEERLENPIE